MFTKTVYSYDPKTLRFIGTVLLSEADGDMSPLEPGVWLIPAYCLETEVPEVPPGHEAFAAVDVPAWIVRAVVEESANEAKFDEAQTPAEKATAAIESLNLVVTEYLEAAAHALKYSTLEAGISYADEPAVAKFYGEGRALRRLRSLVEAAFFERIKSLVDTAAGNDEVLLASLPTASELIDGLPKLDMERMLSDIEAAQASIDAQAAARVAEVATEAAPTAPAVEVEEPIDNSSLLKTKRTTRKKAS